MWISLLPICSFNSRTREGCDAHYIGHKGRGYMSFNSRTREGCDSFKFSTPKGGHVVSIHAPGRGATEDIFLSVRSPRCFNSRTREGCDPTASRWTTTDWSFNSRTREGCDVAMLSRASSLREFQFTHPGGVRRVFFASDAAKTMVSIHAPGRGATCLRTFVHLLHDSFNSRTREGCDLSVLPVMCHSVLFQFTHPGGVRLAIADTLKAQEMGFNSRTREGCDGLHRHHQRLTTQFQFTHPGGVRLLEYDGKSYKRLFQFTHPGGVRQQYPQLELFAIGVSIHAPGRGATSACTPKSSTEEVSIHAPGRGATTQTRYHRLRTDVSIHAPGRGATG